MSSLKVQFKNVLIYLISNQCIQKTCLKFSAKLFNILTIYLKKIMGFLVIQACEN